MAPQLGRAEFHDDSKQAMGTSELFVLQQSTASALCKKLLRAVNDNARLISTGGMRNLPLLLPWRNVERVRGEDSDLHLDLDAIQEMWVDFDNDGKTDHLYKTRLYAHGVPGEILHILSSEVERRARERGVSLADLLSYSDQTFTVSFQDWRTMWKMTGRTNRKSRHQWDMNPNVEQYPLQWSGQTLVIAFNAYAPVGQPAHMFIFRPTRLGGKQRLASLCLFRRPGF